MTSYQGEDWVDVQLATISAQTYRDWRLIIRDDGSTDRTRDIIRSWRDRFPERIVFLDEHEPKNLGDSGNFCTLLEDSSANYIMPSDQDDIWYADKVSKAVAYMQALEKQHGANKPLLVHFDLRMVDDNLREIHPSYCKYQGIRPWRKTTIGNLCLENAVHGCTIIMNRALIQRSMPRPQSGVAGDWWYAFVAGAFGAIHASREITIDYRRHNRNISQSSPSLLATLKGIINPLQHRRAFYAKLTEHRQMAEAVLDRFSDELRAQDRATLCAFLGLQDLGFWARRAAIVRHRLWFTSRIRNIGLLVFA